MKLIRFILSLVKRHKIRIALIIFIILLIAVKYLPTKQVPLIKKPYVELPKPDLKNLHSSFSQTDNEPHTFTSKDYFEWWYYDATFDDGTVATIAFHLKEISNNRRSLINITLLGKDGRSYFSSQNFTPDSFVFEKPGNITLNKSSVRWLENGTVQVIGFGKTSKNEELSMDLIFTPSIPGLKIGDGKIRVNGKVALGWAIPIPRATVKGIVNIAGNIRQVNGNGYQEHAWGEIDLADTFNYWYWGRIFSPDVTAIYFQLNFRKELGVPTAQTIALGNTKRFITIERINQFRTQNLTFLKGANREVPQNINIKSDTLDLNLSVSKILRNSNYGRQLCDYQLKIRLKDLPASSSGQCISEFMFLNKR